MRIELFNVDFIRNIKLLFLPKLLVPNYFTNKLSDAYETIRKLKVKAVILDIDQTIIPYGAYKISPDILLLLKKIDKKYSCCFLSNFPKNKENFTRISRFEAESKIKVVMTNRKKPDPSVFLEALVYLNSKPSEAVMIGDRLLTDIMGSNNIGLNSIYVKPINPITDPTIIKLVRIIEMIIIKIIKLIKK